MQRDLNSLILLWNLSSSSEFVTDAEHQFLGLIYPRCRKSTRRNYCKNDIIHTNTQLIFFQTLPFYLILYSPKKQLYYLRIQCYTKHWVYAHRDLNRYCWYHRKHWSYHAMIIINDLDLYKDVIHNILSRNQK